MARLNSLGEPVTRGERLMLQRLQQALNDDWTVFGNPVVRIGEGSREIDAIVVGPAGVWVVDEKGFGGKLSGDEYAWILPSGEVRERPLDQVEHAAKAVKGRLAQADPRLKGVWVEGLIILSAPDADVSAIVDPRVATRVIRLAEAARTFTTAQAKLSPGQREAVEAALAGAGWVARRRGRIQLPGYEILERGPSGDVVQTYRCRHEQTGEVVEAKVYDLSALPSQSAREACLKRCRQEFSALLQLRNTQQVVRITDSFQPLAGQGGELYYMALDLPQGPSLGARLADRDWPLESRLRAARRLCAIVRDIHAAHVVHRQLHPGCLHLWQTDEDFLVTGFDLPRLPGGTLIVPQEAFPAGPYTAPEVAADYHSATPASDIYSLGVMLYELFSGRRPFGDRPRQNEDSDPALLVTSGAEQASWWDDLEATAQLMVAYQPSDRPSDLAPVIEELDGLLAAGQSVSADPAATPQVSCTHPLACGARLGDYQVLQHLGSGGCFHAYRVAWAIGDESDTFVAKVARDPHVVETARTAFHALNRLAHPNIAQAREVRDVASASYHLLETYVPGQSAADRIAEGPSTAAEVADWAGQLGDALTYMESRQPPVYHGDITPHNLMLADGRPTLVDFGLAHLVGETVEPDGVAGTTPYRPPERDLPGVSWPPSGDVYGLAMTLCELLFGVLPYDCTGGYDRYHLRDDLFTYHAEASAELLGVLRRAIDPDPVKRFASAADFCDALARSPERGGQPLARRTDRSGVAYLDDVLRIYNRGACNAENRGLDSEFARRTYVPTTLDHELLEEILARRYALVVLTGNPGDGKTAFLQQVALRLGREAEALELHHWRIDQDGWSFECVLDGSASDTGRGMASSDEVLSDLLRPLEEVGDRSDLAQGLARTQLLAINEGRLLEYLEDRDEPSWVGENLLRRMGEADGDPHDEILVVDLNRRSLAWGDGDEFETVLEALLEGGREGERPLVDPWAPCADCRAAEQCHVRFNVQTLRDPVLGPVVRQRLRSLLMTIHSRGRLHITMRELRSTLSLLVFGEETCTAIHDELEMLNESGEELGGLLERQRQRLYFNRVFATRNKADKLLAELADFDPAETDAPRLDRMLIAEARGPLGGLALPSTRLPHMALATDQSTPDAVSDRHGQWRRQAYFEVREEAFSGQGEQPWLSLTPFRGSGEWLASLGAFHAGQRALPAGLCWRLCRAVSLTDDVPEALTQRHLVVRTAPAARTPLAVLRLFPLDEFTLAWEGRGGTALAPGALPTAMLLRYGRTSDPTLEISADLFELLMRAAEGFRLGADELQAMAGHLQLFKNRLLAMPAEEVLLDHPVLGRHRAYQEVLEGTRRIVLEAYNE